MPSFQNSVYNSLRGTSGVMDTSALRFVGYVHVLTGFVAMAMGVVSAALFVYLGWLCVGIWTGVSFLICGVLSIIAGKTAGVLTVLFLASTNVLTFNFACMGAVITFSSLFPGSDFYTTFASDKGGHSIIHNHTTGTVLGIIYLLVQFPRGDHSIIHNQTTGTALAILYLVVSLIEIVVCLTSIRISWRILSNFPEGGNLRQAASYDEPFLSSNSWSEPPGMETRDYRRENATPPPDYDAATHSLSTSPKTLSSAGPRPRLYGSIGEADSNDRQGSSNNGSIS